MLDGLNVPKGVFIRKEHQLKVVDFNLYSKFQYPHTP